MVTKPEIGRALGSLIFLCVSALVSCSPAQTAPLRTSAELEAALKNARGGETLELASATFADFGLENRTFDKAVTIKSANPARPAVIERLKMYQVKGIHFADLEVGGAKRSSEPEYAKLAEIRNSSDIRFERTFLHGSIDGNPGNDIWGLAFGDCSDVAVVDGRFTELFRAVVFLRTNNVKLLTNIFQRIRSDGANFDSVHTVRVDGNRFSNFLPIGDDHPDAIQFFNVNGPPSNDIEITNNVLLEGQGTGPQGIFISTAKSGRFKRVRISNNLMYSSGAWHGILVDGADDVTIEGNTTLSKQADDKLLWIALSDVSTAKVGGNVTERLILNNVTNALVSDNLDLEKSPGQRKKLKGVDLGAEATEAGLVLPDIGYRPVVGKGGR